MPKSNPDGPFQKVCLNLYPGDFQRLRDLYGPEVGAGVIIRRLVRVHIEKLEGQQETPQIDVDI